MRTIGAIQAAAEILTGRMPLTYAHDFVEGRRRVVLKPCAKDVVVDGFFTLATMLGAEQSDTFESALAVASRGDDESYARIRASMALALWTLGMSAQNPRMLSSAFVAAGTPASAVAA